MECFAGGVVRWWSFPVVERCGQCGGGGGDEMCGKEVFVSCREIERDAKKVGRVFVFLLFGCSKKFL